MIDLSNAREGQRGAVRTILQRVVSREFYTAIVLPCGYGKRDVIWMSAAELILNKLVSKVLVLNHNEVLRDQMVDPANVQDVVQRYRVTHHQLPYRKLEPKHHNPGVNFDANGEVLISTLMQLVQNNVETFHRWIRQKYYETQLPVLLCIDECQSETEQNTWGDTVKKLMEDNSAPDGAAYAVLLTATPFRSDKRPLTGFACEQIEEEPTFHYTAEPSQTPGLRKIQQYRATDFRYCLRAHWETTMRQAWEEEVIVTLCDFPYDIAGEELTIERDLGIQKLSLLTADRARSYLGKLVWDTVVIREGVKRFAESLAAYKALATECAGIIFCANDLFGGEANAHAKRIQQILAAYQPQWNIRIATSTEARSGIETLNLFRRRDQPVGDVLIVKQMAGVGLDTPRLKVGLDLSPLRADNGWVQRLMRLCRPYKGLKGVWHRPADILSQRLWEIYIAGQGGGEQKFRDIHELLREYEKPEPPPGERRTFVVDLPENADFSDSEAVLADAPYQNFVRDVLVNFPALVEKHTYAAIANFFAPRLKAEFLADVPRATDQRLQEKREQCVQLAKTIAGRRMRGHNRPFNDCIRDVWNESKSQAGIALNTELPHVSDLQQLNDLQKVLARIDLAERHSHVS